MPYHGGDRSSRYAFDDQGQPMTMHKFCEFYDEIAISKESLQRLNLNQKYKRRNRIFRMVLHVYKP